mgnify:CR=1 FL=1
MLLFHFYFIEDIKLRGNSIYYKIELAQTEEKSAKPNEVENVETQNKTNETEEQLKQQEGNGADLPSSDKNGEKPPTNSGEQPNQQPAKEAPVTEEVELEKGYIVGHTPATEPTCVKGVLKTKKKNLKIKICF